MAKPAAAEKWRDVSFDFKFTNDYRLQVSNLGNLRAYNKFSAGELLTGSMVNDPKDKKRQYELKVKTDQNIIR